MNSSIILESKGKYVLDYISSGLDVDSVTSIVQKNTDEFNIKNLRQSDLTLFVNINRINEVRDVNRLLAAVNEKLVTGGVFIGCIETLEERRKRLLKKYPPVINVFYYLIDFLVKRVLSKLYLTRRL